MPGQAPRAVATPAGRNQVVLPLKITSHKMGSSPGAEKGVEGSTNGE